MKSNPNNFIYLAAKEFKIFVTGDGEYRESPTHEDESYEVEVNKAGSIIVTSSSVPGAIYGISTVV